MNWCSVIVLPGLLTSGMAEISFNREIRPILSENCFYCHGQDGNKRKAGLRLDQREGAMKPNDDKEIAIVPGKPEESSLIRRLLSTDPDEVMPPANSHRTVTPAQKDLLKRWIAEGANYETHWAFVTPNRPPLPEVKRTDWSKNPLDRFILAKLEKEAIPTSPEADRTTLIRRLSLDLIGLPPKPEEVDAFVNDPSPDAYEKLVDRLMASPHYGERMALPWLDAARYADSNGFQQDGDTFQWVWRDWVVRQLNADMPFDQFSIEQLAGDLLPTPSTDQLVATAFNRNHLLNGEGGAIAEEQRYNNLFDRVDTTSTTWLGLTMACAQCHDHKYDPLTQRDYYSMLALFNNVPESGVPSGSGQYRVADPSIPAGAPEDMAKLKDLEAAAKAASQEEKQQESTAETNAALETWVKAMSGDGVISWSPLKPISADATDGVTLVIQEDAAIFAKGPRPDKANYTIALPGSINDLTGLRIETIPDDKLPSKGAGRSDSGNAVLTKLTLKLGDKEIPFNDASADYTQGGFTPKGPIDNNPATDWAFYPDTMHPHALVVQTTGPVSNPSGAPMTLILEFQSKHVQHQLGKFRISATTVVNPVGRAGVPADLAAILKKPDRSKEDTAKLRDYFLKNSPPAPVFAARKKREAADKSLADHKAAVPRVMIMSDAKPRQTKMLDRGNYLAQTTDVQGAMPAFIAGSATSGKPATRLDFAKWLFTPEHPLTARVQTNRMWQHFFGTGLVKNAEDFGVQGELPVHQELLDWLAVEFREHGWSMKHINRLIVTSATFRQSSRVIGLSKERDPENRLLSRGGRFRAPAMILRDVALSASGLLDERIGGKPVYPYQPEAIWETLAITKERDFTYPASKGADLYRRSLYTFWRRTIGPANMFDASNRQTCKVRTSITSTPLHALTTLNDLTWTEAARVLAAKSMEAASDEDGQLRHAFRRILGRQPTASDLTALKRAMERQRTIYQADLKAAKEVVNLGQAPANPKLNVVEHAALTNVCLAIFNLDEALTHE